MYKRVPTILSFDAFNTLIVPKKPVLQQYVEYGCLNGVDNIAEDQLKANFPTIFKSLELKYPNYGKSQGLSYLDWWRLLIKGVYAPVQLEQKFVDGLIEWFSSKNAYSTFPDVVTTIENYSQKGDFVLVCSSNGDPRILEILESLNIAKYFHKIYLSYDIGHKKPDKSFFDYVINDIMKHYNSSERSQILKQSWHFGDEVQNDFEGSFNAGWNSVLVDRKGDTLNLKGDAFFQDKLSKSLSTKPLKTELHKIGERKYVISDFSRVLDLPL